MGPLFLAVGLVWEAIGFFMIYKIAQIKVCIAHMVKRLRLFPAHFSLAVTGPGHFKKW